MTITHLAAPLSSAWMTAVLLAIFCYLRPPEWLHKYQGSWRRVNAVSMLSAAVLAGFSVVTWRSTPLLPLTAIAVSTALLTFAATQALFTDPQLRLVDRRMLHLAMVPPLVLHALVMKDMGPLLTVWLIFMLVSAALIFLPGLMGASDGRALLLVAVAAFPPLGTKYFAWGFGGFLLLVLVYAFIKAAQHPAAKSPMAYLKAVVEKRSVPAVPMILFPFAVLLPLVGLLSA